MAVKAKDDAVDTKLWLGFDLGGTKMLATVFDAEFGKCGRERKRTKGHEGLETGIERIVSVIHAALADAGAEPGDLGGIGIGCPGPVDARKGVVLHMANLGWEDAPLRSALHARFDCPVVVVNDVDAGVYGEYCFGAGKGGRCVLGVFPGTGIGGGCVKDGKVLQGARLSCMELGHIPTVPDGALCGCGQRGCLETVASRLSVASAAAAAAYRGQAPALLALAGTDLSNIRSGALAESIGQGDTVVERIVRDSAEWLGWGVAVAVNLMGPDVVVLGGGLVEALPDWYRKTVEQAARAHAMGVYADTFKVVSAKLGDDATVLGAAAWAREQARDTGKGKGK